MRRNHIWTSFIGHKFGTREFYKLLYVYNPHEESVSEAWKNANMRVNYFCEQMGVHGMIMTRRTIEKFGDGYASKKFVMFDRNSVGYWIDAELQRVWFEFRKAPSLRLLEVMVAEMEDMGYSVGTCRIKEFENAALEIIND